MLSSQPVQNEVPSLLREHYLARLQRNGRYSLRAYARDLDLSHSHLSRVLNGRRNLSLKQGIQVSQRLGIAPDVRRKLLQNISDQMIAEPKEARVEKTASDFVVNVDRFKCFSEWYHVAILELTSLANFQSSEKWIAKQLGISLKEARAAVSRLKRLKLLETSGGRWRRMHDFASVPTYCSSEAIRSFHRQMIGKALQEFDRTEQHHFSRRDVAGSTVAIDPQYLPMMKKQIIAFRKSLIRKYSAKGNPTELYQFNTQLFPLTGSKK